MAPKLSKPLSAGDVVFTAKPLMHIVFKRFKGKHCDNCLKRSDQLKKCSKCLQMSYCDKSCQTIDWIYHKTECKVLRKYGFILSDVHPRQRLLLRLYLCIKADKTFATKRHQLIDGSDVCLNDIKVNVKDILKTMYRFIEFKGICGDFRSSGIDFNGEELLHWFAFIANSIKIITQLIPYNNSYSLIPAIGCGLYIPFSSLTHSCIPNCAVVDNGLSIELRAMKSIPIGEELTVSAITLSTELSERKRYLKLLCIDCQCIKCQQNIDSDIDYDIIYKYYEMIVLINDFIVSPTLVNEYIETVDKLLPIIDRLFGEYCPNKTIVYFHLLDTLLEFNHSDEQRVHQLINEFKANAKVTHPSDHEIIHIIDTSYETYCFESYLSKALSLFHF